MDWSILHRGEPTAFGGSIIRDGKIFARPRSICMEERYPVAYNLGSGDTRWPGWIGVDIDPRADLQSDLRKLPIESDSADAVAAIHVVEHFYEWEVPELLTEWKRILKPGGKMILELPCMNKVADYIGWCSQNKQDMLPFMSIQALYGDAGPSRNEAMAHKFGWFTAPLIRVLESIGMREVTVCQCRYHFPCRDMRLECTK